MSIHEATNQIAAAICNLEARFDWNMFDAPHNDDCEGNCEGGCPLNEKWNVDGGRVEALLDRSRHCGTSNIEKAIELAKEAASIEADWNGSEIQDVLDHFKPLLKWIEMVEDGVAAFEKGGMGGVEDAIDAGKFSRLLTKVYKRFGIECAEEWNFSAEHSGEHCEAVGPHCLLILHPGSPSPSWALRGDVCHRCPKWRNCSATNFDEAVGVLSSTALLLLGDNVAALDKAIEALHHGDLDLALHHGVAAGLNYPEMGVIIDEMKEGLRS